MIGIVYSLQDPAGAGIAEYIKRNIEREIRGSCNYAPICYLGEKFILAGFNEDVLQFGFLDQVMPGEVDFYLVLSRHSSEAGIKSYTVHATGNFSYTEIAGGRPRELGIAYPRVMWFLLRALYRNTHEVYSRVDYEVSYEATHHGPTNLSKPIVFIEIGSSLNEWRDPVNHSLVGETVLLLLREYPNLPSCKPVIGIGGGHYPRKHTELALSEDVCYGHIASKHVVDLLDAEMLTQMTKRSHDDILEVIVEKKSLRRERRELVEEFTRSTSLNLRYI